MITPDILKALIPSDAGTQATTPKQKSDQAAAPAKTSQTPKATQTAPAGPAKPQSSIRNPDQPNPGMMTNLQPMMDVLAGTLARLNGDPQVLAMVQANIENREKSTAAARLARAKYLDELNKADYTNELMIRRQAAAEEARAANAAVASARDAKEANLLAIEQSNRVAARAQALAKYKDDLDKAGDDRAQRDKIELDKLKQDRIDARQEKALTAAASRGQGTQARKNVNDLRNATSGDVKFPDEEPLSETEARVQLLAALPPKPDIKEVVQAHITQAEHAKRVAEWEQLKANIPVRARQMAREAEAAYLFEKTPLYVQDAVDAAPGTEEYKKQTVAAVKVARVLAGVGPRLIETPGTVAEVERFNLRGAIEDLFTEQGADGTSNISMIKYQDFLIGMLSTYALGRIALHKYPDTEEGIRQAFHEVEDQFEGTFPAMEEATFDNEVAAQIQLLVEQLDGNQVAEEPDADQ